MIKNEEMRKKEEEIMKQLPDKNLPEVKLHDLMIKLKSTELPKLGEK